MDVGGWEGVASVTSLLLCRHSGVGNHDCDHSEDASVLCRGNGGENN